MARILRGEVRWAELNPVRGHEQAGRRPVLVLTLSVDRIGARIARAAEEELARVLDDLDEILG